MTTYLLRMDFFNRRVLSYKELVLRLSQWSLVALIILGGIALDDLTEARRRSEADLSRVTAKIDAMNSAEKEKTRLYSFTMRAMSVVQAPLNPIMRQIVARQVSEVTSVMIKNHQRQESFIAMLAVESKFNPRAKSGVGALGIGQIMPQYAGEFAGECGLGDNKIGADDLLETEINLRLAACHFNQLLDKVGGNSALALAAYNAGLYSRTRSDLQNLKNVNDETANYIAKHTMLIGVMQAAQMTSH